MPLVPAKCISCGAILKVDDTLDAAVCDYCRTPFIIDKAINNYTINNQYTINAAGVNIVNGLSTEDKLNNADTFLNVHKDYAKAEKFYSEATDEEPSNYRGWWGLLAINTHNFTDVSMELDSKTVSLYESAMKVVDSNKKPGLDAIWDRYVEKRK